jgi:hypothetical protein
MVKNKRIFQKWSNCSKRLACWWKIQRFFESGLIVSGNLPVGEKKTWKFFNFGLIVIGDLPNEERYEDFFLWSNFHGRPGQVKNSKVFFNISLIVMGDLSIDERYEDFFF